MYNPKGAAVRGNDIRAIVWDAQPCHGGIRWAIVAKFPLTPHSVNLNVIPLTPDVFPAD